MSKYFLLALLLMISACNSLENQSVDLESVKSNPLLVPPCVDK